LNRPEEYEAVRELHDRCARNGDDRGAGAAYFMDAVAPRDGPVSVPHGTYRDELRRVDGRWYLSSRTAMIEAGRTPEMR
jgi:hypothetical protein